MEFYLGDNSLKNDKFLQSLVFKNKKQYIDLVIFLKFNKIKNYLADIPNDKDKLQTIIIAIQGSPLLKLNKLNSKVRRRVKFDLDDKSFQLELDKKTIYVENLPDCTTHELIATVFSRAGNILHSSIPKYDSKKIKGFAFIEFQVIWNGFLYTFLSFDLL